ncbi:hypothetical protein [Shewanella sp.]
MHRHSFVQMSLLLQELVGIRAQGLKPAGDCLAEAVLLGLSTP